MKSKLCLAIFFCAVIPNLAYAELPTTRTEVVHHDPLGVWRRSRSFQRMSQQGVKTVFMPEENNFFAYWMPPHYRSGRIMVAIHGTGGNPYEELKDEIPMAGQFDYLVVAMNWYLEDRGGFMSAADLYRQILEALNFVKKEFGSDLSSVAYIGFSRGGAVSYEIAHLDVTGEHVFDFLIAHSGGIPKDLRIEAKNPNSEQDHFFYQLTHGELGPDAMKGAQFFLYSGDRDQNWGSQMSEQMAYAKELITRYGGHVVEWVRDPNGDHAGLRKNRSINEKAIQHFIELTP